MAPRKRKNEEQGRAEARTDTPADRSGQDDAGTTARSTSAEDHRGGTDKTQKLCLCGCGEPVSRTFKVVAGVAPYGFRFTPDRKNFEVEEGEAVVVRKIFSMAASGTSLNAIASALEREGVPTPRGARGRLSRLGRELAG